MRVICMINSLLLSFVGVSFTLTRTIFHLECHVNHILSTNTGDSSNLSELKLRTQHNKLTFKFKIYSCYSPKCYLDGLIWEAEIKFSRRWRLLISLFRNWFIITVSTSPSLTCMMAPMAIHSSGRWACTVWLPGGGKSRVNDDRHNSNP